MADIHIHRPHTLGLAKARKMAFEWAEAVEEKFAMECTVVEGQDHDRVEFRRAGVQGVLRVEASAFDLTATLGFLLGAFGGKIKAEIEAQLDALVPPASAKRAPARAARPASMPAGAAKTVPGRAATTKRR